MGRMGLSMESFRSRLLFFLFRKLRRVQLCKCSFYSGRRSYEKCWRQWFRWRPQLLMAICATGFSFRENGISDEVMQEEAKMSAQNDEKEEWEVVRNEENSKVLRRLHEDTGLYEFRCSGSYDDITASDFVDAQMDLVFRQKWDTNVEKLQLVRKDEDTDSELIHWIAKFPYPMYPREYVFVRRRYINAQDRCIVIANCAVANSASIIPPCEKKYVRVETYRSVMVVRAHQTFDSKGFDYVLSYYDNPESNIPKYAYNWLINSGGPYYLQQVHEAAKELERQRAETSAKKVSAEEEEITKSLEESAEKLPRVIAKKASDVKMEEEEEVEFVVIDLPKKGEAETESSEEDSETMDTADIKSDMASSSSLLRYLGKPKPVQLREYYVFVD